MTTLAAVLLLFCGACVKGILGVGLPMIAIPGLTLVLGLPTALAIVALPVGLANAWQVWQFRRAAETKPIMPSFLSGGAAGVLIGTWALSSISPEVLEAGLGLILIVYLGLQLGRSDLALPMGAAIRLAPATGFAAGFLHGATGISSPVGVTYFHAMRLRRPAFVFSTGAMFLGFTVVQIPALIASGLLDGPRLAASAATLPAVALGLWAGNRAAAYVDARFFDRMILAVLLVTAISLLWQSMPHLLG